MATSPAVMAPSRPIEDPLAHLARTNVVEYPKGQTIYSQQQPSLAVYLVISGKVKVSRLAGDGRQVVVDIYRPDDLFGESAFLDAPPRSDQAVAMEDTRLMSWSCAEIEAAIAKRPRLGMALLQILVQRTGDLTRRVESLSVGLASRHSLLQGLPDGFLPTGFFERPSKDVPLRFPGNNADAIQVAEDNIAGTDARTRHRS